MHPYIYIFSHALSCYGVMACCGFLTAGGLGVYRAVKAKLRWDDAAAIAAFAFGFALMGASVLYVLVSYSPGEIIEMFRDGSIFSGNKVGLVFYGGLLGSIPGIVLAGRLLHTDIRSYVPVLLPCLPLGHAFGRIGCLLGGCCYGAPTSLPIGIVYINPLSDAPRGVPLLPVPLFEAAGNLLICFALCKYCRKGRDWRKCAALYSACYGCLRFCLEFMRYDRIRGIWFGLSTSQWISLAMLCASAILIASARADKAHSI